ncbi:MAG: hypothetical protein ACLFQK_06980 [Fibrobacterota bacterium]
MPSMCWADFGRVDFMTLFFISPIMAEFMINIFDYEDYRKSLSDYYKEKKERNVTLGRMVNTPGSPDPGRTAA